MQAQGLCILSDSVLIHLISLAMRRTKDYYAYEMNAGLIWAVDLN